MTTLRGSVRAAGGLARRAGPGRPQPRPGQGGLRAALTRHRAFLVALAPAVLLRLVALAGFQPAVLFRLDSFDYLWGAVHVAPNPVNPSGYSLLLWLMRPLHSLVAVTAVQQLLGLAAAALMYAFLRSRGLPGWGATLTAAPVLLLPAELLLERLIMADLMALVLMLAGLVVALWRDPPPARQAAMAGALLGLSAVVRPTCLPLLAVIPAYLLARRAGWRCAAAALAAGALPVAGYIAWFAATTGTINMTSSNGLFLWSRTMSFADCGVIRPPPSLRPLCPGRQAGIPAIADPARRPLPRNYLWDRDAWQWQPPTSGLVPDSSAFTAAKNSRALAFAVRAIAAQPGAYLRVVTSESILALEQPGLLSFPRHQPRSAALNLQEHAYALAAVRAYTGSGQGLAPYLGYRYGTRLYEPYASFVQDYQRVVFLPGPLLALAGLVGLAGLAVPRRRCGAGALLLVCAAITLVLPVAEHEYVYRYAFPAVPLICLAAALALRAPAEAAEPAGLAGR